MNESEEFLIATNSKIRSFIDDDQKTFTFSLGKKIRLDEIFWST